MNNLDAAQFTGTVQTCIFKGVHYEMTVITKEGYEVMIQDYNCFEVGSEVGMLIKPADIQVMKKERICNTFEGEMLSEESVEILGVEFECGMREGFEKGDKVMVEVDFNKIDLQDNLDEGETKGSISFILYKGNHYHITIKTEEGYHVYVDTNDVWDKNDIVGIKIAPADMRITKISE